MVFELEYTSVLVAVCIFLLTLYLSSGSKNDRFPAGPWKLPILGNLHQIMWYGDIMKFCEANRRKYGSVFTIEIGGAKRVVLSGYDAFQLLLVKNAEFTSDRSVKSMPRQMIDTAEKTPGILWAPPPHWKSLRSFTLTTLRRGGMGKATIEPQILSEISQYMKVFIEPHEGKPVEHGISLALVTCNIISQLMFGNRREYDDQVFIDMITALNTDTQTLGITSTFKNVPFSSWLLASIVNKSERLVGEQYKVLKVLIDEHKDSVDPASPRDVMDNFIINREQEQNGSSVFSDDNAVTFAYHLYSAGTMTTAHSLAWVILMMCLHQEVQEKVFSEINKEIGSREVSNKDRLNMPYTEAVIRETMRKVNLAPTALPLTASKDLYVDGKLIPTGADILLNMDSVLCDPEVFDEPYKFKPERFLTGDIEQKKQRAMYFGIGRRECVGKSLAKMELFMFMVSILQRYHLALPVDSKVTEEPVTDFFNMPQPYKIIYTGRA